MGILKDGEQFYCLQKQAILMCLESLEALGIVANHAEEGQPRWDLAELQKSS